MNESKPPITWNSLVVTYPGAHILQTNEWGQFKGRYGWQPLHIIWNEQIYRIIDPTISPSYNAYTVGPERPVAVAQVLRRNATIYGLDTHFCILYVPKGPLLDWTNATLCRRVLSDLARIAQQQHAIFIKIDPDICLATGFPGSPEDIASPYGDAITADLMNLGWHFSAEQIQFRNTILIDLSKPETELLADMKQKTRYNIRLAGRRGVSVRQGGLNDLDTLYRLYAITSVRDGFVIRDAEYYKTLWKSFMRSESTAIPHNNMHEYKSISVAEPLIASVGETSIAAVIPFRFAGKAWFLFGMSLEEHRDKMPNHLLQWEAIRTAKAHGCTTYDFWGAPDNFIENDTLWGVYRFKEGFGGKIVRSIGAWDLVINPVLYKIYNEFLPHMLGILRRRGKSLTQSSIHGV